MLNLGLGQYNCSQPKGKDFDELKVLPEMLSNRQPSYAIGNKLELT